MKRALLILALAGCAATPTPRGIARGLAFCLDWRKDMPLELRCECLSDAEERCEALGLDARCATDGWVDADRDGWTIAACRVRR